MENPMVPSPSIDRRNFWIIVGLCAFIAFLAFKPSEPYLSEYLTCNETEQADYCSSLISQASCNSGGCTYSATSLSCSVTPCIDVPLNQCGDEDTYYYCETSGAECVETKCYKNFTEDEVNDEIYPWSTYAYLPFLLVLGPFAEMVSYRVAILFGIVGRVITRFLLLYGTTLVDMQLMQVVYALGTAAEDVFAAFVYYVVSPKHYQLATSSVQAAHLISNMLSGITGDILVVEYDASLSVLMWISAAFVCTGFFVGLVILKPASITITATTTTTATGTDISPCATAGSVVSKHAVADGAVGSRDGGLSLNNPVVSPLAPTAGGDKRGGTKDREGKEAEQGKGGGGRDVEESERACSVSSRRSSTASQMLLESGKLKWAQKVAIFKRQITCLRIALRSKALLAMVALWVVGNAVYATLYDYEVSIYEELNGGSNNWNGSVLAIMLLMGAFGAMLPHYLDKISAAGSADSNANTVKPTTDSFTRVENDVAASSAERPGLICDNESENKCGGHDLNQTGVGSTLHKEYGKDDADVMDSADVSPHSYSLLLQHFTTSPPPSSSFILSTSHAGSTTPPAAVTLLPVGSELIAAVRIIASSVVASASLLLFVSSWELVASVAFLAIFFAAWQFIHVIVFARLALQLKIAQIEMGAASNLSSKTSVSSDSTFAVGQEIVGEIVETRYKPPSTNSSDQSAAVGASINSFTGTCVCERGIVVERADSRTQSENALNENNIQLKLRNDLQANGNSDRRNSTHLGKEVIDIEPPYSIAIVGIIAANALLQIILQAILFSSLQVTLLTASWVLFFVFLIAASCYCLITLWWFGYSTIRGEMEKATNKRWW